MALVRWIEDRYRPRGMMKQHLINWSREPIVVPRWMLTLKYLAFVILGTLSVIGGIPSISEATFTTFTTYWSGGLVVSAAIATVASFRRAWESLEKWSVLLVSGFLLTWVVAAIVRAAGEGDLGRMAGAFSVLVITMLPVARTIDLMGRAGR